MNKKQQEEQRRQEDLALVHGLLWVVGAVVLEVLLFLANRYAFDYDATAQGVAMAEAVRGVLGVLRWVGLAAFVGGGAMLGAQMNKKGKNVWPAVVSVAGIVVLICAYVALKYQTTGMRMLYLLVAVLGGLALSFYIYQRDFFLCALPVVAAVLGLWFVRVDGMLETVVTMIAGAVILGAVLLLKKNGGAVKGVQLLPEKANYNLALGSAVAALAVQALACVAGGVVAYYLIFAMGAWLFALLVYYTVKML